MSTKTYISTSLLLFLAACSEGNKQTPQHSAQEKPHAPKQEKAETTPEQASMPLDDQSALPFLRAFGKKNKQSTFDIETRFGTIRIALFEDTPLHRASFAYLANQRYFDDTWFYRVSKGHVIQAGNNDEMETVEKRRNIGFYTIPKETEVGHLHVYGAVAAARPYENNPEKRSDPFEFYIVLGRKYNQAQLELMSEQYGFSLNPEKIALYSKQGGAPHLDGEHTVFGYVLDGMDVVLKIAQQQVGEGDWPIEDIPIKIKSAD